MRASPSRATRRPVGSLASRPSLSAPIPSVRPRIPGGACFPPQRLPRRPTGPRRRRPQPGFAWIAGALAEADCSALPYSRHARSSAFVLRTSAVLAVALAQAGRALRSGAALRQALPFRNRRKEPRRMRGAMGEVTSEWTAEWRNGGPVGQVGLPPGWQTTDRWRVLRRRLPDRPDAARDRTPPSSAPAAAGTPPMISATRGSQWRDSRR